MLTLQQRADAGIVWFKRLSPLHRRIVIAAAVISFGLILFGVARWHHRSQPGYVLEVLEGINSRADADAKSEYLTPQGKDLLIWAIEKRGDKPPTGEKPIYSEPVISDIECLIPFHGREGGGTIRLQYSDHWRFDDMYIDTFGNEHLEVWGSELKAHPFKSIFKRHWRELLGAFLKGLLMGAGAAR